MSKYLLDDKSWKSVYKLDKPLKRTFIEDVLAQIGFKNDVTEIRTGRAGQLALQKAESKYIDKIVLDESFDPIYADESVNRLYNGWRLSSYIYYITIDDQTVKIVPLAPE